MNDKDYLSMIELTYMGGGFIPANERADELVDRCHKGEIVAFKEITARDAKFHRAYFLLLKMVYGYLPKEFKKAVPEDKFYRFVQHLQGKYNVVFEFKDGSKLVEYESISFGRMSQKTFELYVTEQLPFIYEEVVGKFFDGDIRKNIIETIEDDFKVFLSKL